MADGSNMIIYGTIDLSCASNLWPFLFVFNVANITDNAFLGMNFFQENQGSLHLAQETLEVNNQLIACVDRTGQHLVSKVQVTHAATISGGQEALITCRISSTSTSSIGLVEQFVNTPEHLASLNKVDKHNHLTVRCLNTKPGTLSINAGTISGLYTPLPLQHVYRLCRMSW